jgi:hypothetical protein
MTADRLVGSDASFFKATVAAIATTSGTMAAGSYYKIATISGTTVFPTGYAVGDIFIGDSAKSLSATNSAYLLTATEETDANSFKIEFSSDEISVTTLSDGVKKYRKGKTDMSGNVEGINFISEMKKAGSILNRFLKTANATSAYVVSTLQAVDKSDVFGVFYLQDDGTTAGETQAFMIAQIEFFGYSLGAAVADAQAWSSGIRLIGNDPIVYFKANS